MTLEISSLTYDALDPDRQTAFWAAILDRPHDGWVVLPASDEPATMPIRFVLSREAKVDRPHLHPDLTSSSPGEQEATVARALGLGARHLDIGQGGDEGHVVLADPEGNELCVIEPDNDFLAGCGRVGCLAGDGSYATGHFWSAALGWPLVWDEGEETAIQSPAGGTKISWGGTPLMTASQKWRPHLDLVPSADSGVADEVARLVALGASYADVGQGDVAWVVLADPDGHPFCVQPRPPTAGWGSSPTLGR